MTARANNNAGPQLKKKIPSILLEKRKANQRGAYITENAEGFIQSYIQHSDSFGKKFVQMLPEVLKQQSKKISPSNKSESENM